MDANVSKLADKINSKMPKIDNLNQNNSTENLSSVEHKSKIEYLKSVIRILEKNQDKEEKDPQVKYFKDYTTKSEAELKLIQDHMDYEVKKPEPYKLSFGGASKGN